MTEAEMITEQHKVIVEAIQLLHGTIQELGGILFLMILWAVAAITAFSAKTKNQTILSLVYTMFAVGFVIWWELR